MGGAGSLGSAAMDVADAPLAGVRVVEISQYVQGPVAGLTLASLGADVVKIEQVGRRDAMRDLGSMYGVRLDERARAWQYAALNRGKRSVALDVTHEAGRAAFERLIERADVFVTNLRERGLVALGADAETLHRLNPRLVYARGGGFGFAGDVAEDPCQDTVGMAYAGFMDLLATGEEPNYPPGALSDVLTGTSLASAALAGLVRRGFTGRGDVVGTTQVQSLLWLQMLPVGMVSTIGERMPRFDRAHPPNPLFAIYPTTDSWISLAAIHPPQWPPVAHALGLEALLDDERFASFEQALRNRLELAPLLEARFATNTTAHWWDALRRAGVWTAPVHRIDELSSDKGVLDNEYLVEFGDGFVGPPAPFDVGEWRGARASTADYGEHTDAVLAELGYDEDQVVELRLAGAIW